MRCVTISMMISRAILSLAFTATSRLAKFATGHEVSGRQHGSLEAFGLRYLPVTTGRIGRCEQRGLSVSQRKIIPRWDGSPGHMTHRAE